MKMKNRFGLKLSSDINSGLKAVYQLLKLGIENKVRMIVLAPTKPSEPIQITGYTSRGQAKIRFIPDQRRFVDVIRTRIKILAGMMISKKDIPQFGRIAFSMIKGDESSQVIISATVTPTKHGEVIILVF
jgi:hypothetical protein